MATEPTPGSGSHSNTSGSSELLFGVGKLTSSIDRLDADIRKSEERASRPQGSSDPHFSAMPGIQSQWDSVRAFHSGGDRMAAAKRQMDRNRQMVGQTSMSAPTPGFPKMPDMDYYASSTVSADPSTVARVRQQQAYGQQRNAIDAQDLIDSGNAARARAQAAGQARGNPYGPPRVFPQMGVPAQPAPVGGGAPGQPGFMGQRTMPPVGNLGIKAAQAAYNNGGVVGGGRLGGARAGINGPNIPGAAGGAAAGEGLGAGAAVGIGIAGGVMTAAGNALNNYSQRMLNTNYDQFGNMVVLRNGGYSGQTYGDASAAGIDKLRPGVNVATSSADLIGGGAQILVNSGSNFTQNFAGATQSAYITPGQGLSQAASNQQEEGTNRASVLAQGLFGTPTRLAGGTQLSESKLADSMLTALTGGQGYAGMTPDKMAAMLQQGGSLRSTLQNYAQNAGLDQNAVDSIANNLTAKAAFQNKYGSTDEFDSTVSAASKGDKGAIDKLKGTGIGESVEQSILTRQGAKTNRDMNSQATFIDTLKETNTIMTDISDKFTSLLKGLGISDVMGAVGGANAGLGGAVGKGLKVAGYAATGAAIGSIIPGVGTLAGGLIGGAYGFISGGASDDKNAKSGDTQNNAPASTGVSTAASAAVSYAQNQVGKPYVSGATGPNAFDCSGLMQAAFKAGGATIPRVSSDQSLFGTAVPLDQIAPGDLIFPKGYDGANGAPAGLPGHVQMALSGGPVVSIVEAANPRVGVRDSQISVSDIESVRRMTNGVGTLSPNMNKSATGATNTNANTAAGDSQAAGSPGGMNEVDVLGSVLSGGFQSPITLPKSPQISAASGSINGTASKLPGYANGVLDVNGNQTANLHDGEMVIPSRQAASLRAALMSDIPTSRDAGAPRGGPANINFASGAIQVRVSGIMSNAAATDAARQIVDAMSADDRIQQIGVGL